MSDWIDISEYDKLKIKPNNCMFLFKATKSKRNACNELSRTVEKSRVYGFRECSHYLQLPEFPKESD